MSNYTNLKNAIQSVIKANGNNEITGPILQAELLSMITTLGAGYQYIGVAQPSTNPGTPDARVMYLAYLPGTYVNFGGLTVTGFCVLKYDTVWAKEDIPISGGGGGADFLTEPDDLTLEAVGNTNILKFANRSYNSENPNGMGYKILRNDLTFAEQVTGENTIFEIRYEFDLAGSTISIPNNCVLLFNGGSIKNGQLNNVGKVVNATIGCISALIGSFANGIKVIRTSEYGVGIDSQPAFNKSIFQAAIDQQIAIEIDTTASVSTQQNEAGFDYGIIFNEPINITQIRASIRGVGFEGGALYFPNGDAFVYNQKKYYSHNCFENLTISAKRFVFNFVNCVTEGTVNANRPYNIYQSVFRNLRVKSLESDCFYQGGVVGVGGDAAMMFQNLFSNISLWTPRYGFNGLNGQTDFVVEHLTDVYVPESFFYNTFPNVVRYVNSSFSGTKNFMRFGGDLTNYDIRIRCEYCSFEDYTEEIFIDTALSSNPTRNYRVSLYKCGFSYSNQLFPSGKVELFPIKLNSIREFNLRETPEPSIGYGTNFGIMWSTALNNIDVDIPVKLYYGYNSQQTYYGYYEARPLMSKRQTIAGSYPNYVMPQETDFLKAVAMMADSYGFNPETIDVSSNRTPTIKTTFAVFSASAAAQIDYITPTPLSVLGGVANQTAYNQFGKFLMIYNASDFNITFNNGYANSLVAEDTPFLVVRPKEFLIAVYDFSKQTNRFVVVKRLNGLVKYGNTNQRPTLTVYEAGFTFYDRQLLKMILWNGTAWVNIDGTAL